MRRRNVITGLIAFAAVGGGTLLYLDWRSRTNRLQLINDVKREIRRDFQALRTVTRQNWILSDTENKLLASRDIR